MMMLAERLKTLREGRGLTQLELSRELHIAPSTIGMYETGRREPDYDNLKRIARFFTVSPNDLIGWGEESPQATAEVPRIFQSYRRLQPHNRQLVDQLITALYSQQVATV